MGPLRRVPGRTCFRGGISYTHSIRPCHEAVATVRSDGLAPAVRFRQRFRAATTRHGFCSLSPRLSGKEGKLMETILIVVVLLFLLGGGGYYWNSRRG